TGGVAVIHVGAATETEMKYLKLKIEDAVNATKAAIEEGIVAGGGVALFKAAQEVREKIDKKHDEQRIGYEIVLNAAEEPLKQIIFNAGVDVDRTTEEVLSLPKNGGYNALTN